MPSVNLDLEIEQGAVWTWAFAMIQTSGKVYDLSDYYLRMFVREDDGSVESGTLTQATNADPTVITSVAHGLETDDVITIVDHQPSADLYLVMNGGPYTVTVLNADTFTIADENGVDFDKSGDAGTDSGTGTWFTPPAIMLLDEANGGIYNRLTRGTFLVQQSATLTAAMDFNRAVYTLEMVFATITALASGTGWDLNINDGTGGGGTITASGGTPFAGLSTSNYLRVTGSDNANDWPAFGLGGQGGVRPTNTLATLSTLMPGTTNADDDNAVVSSLVLNEGAVLRLAQGRIILNREVPR